MNYIIFDLEATCWLGRPPGGHNEVIEIGAYKINAYGEILDKFSKFVKPTVNPLLSHFCTKLTSIEQHNVDAAYHFPRVIEDFKNWIDIYDEDYVLCSWGAFDIQLLKNDCNLHRLEIDWLDYNADLKNQYKKIRGMDKHSGLKNTLKREGFEFSGIHHRAIADAENLCKIFLKFLDSWEVE